MPLSPAGDLGAGWLRHPLNAADLGLPQLGYIIENRLVQLALLRRMEDFPNIQTHTPAAVKSLRQSADEAVLTLDDGSELAARWVLACDGAESHTRKLAGIGVSRFEYRQHCMLINIDTDFAQEDITWQFTPSGPRLPAAAGPARFPGLV